MLTIKEVFKNGISEGNWDVVRDVYKAMTGEEAPAPPKPSTDILSQPFSFSSENKEDVVELGHKELTQEHEQPPQDIVHEAEPTTEGKPPKEITPKNATAQDFAIQHKKSSANQSGDERQCRREPINTTQKRQNTWEDDGSFDHERVDKHPDDPTLGVQHVRPRGNRDENIGVDTSRRIDVVCGLCGKHESVAPILATNYREDPDHNAYRCNECNSPKGRAKNRK